MTAPIRTVRILLTLLLALPIVCTPGLAGARPAPPTGFVLPVALPAVVLTPFRAPESPYGPGHRGVDLAAAVGSPVVAAGDGLVRFAAAVAGRPVVSIEHAGGLRTTYEPVTASVRVGARVSVGRPIGTLQPGHPGCAPASCLHWGARLPDRIYLDPMALLTTWEVRLLPWDGRSTPPSSPSDHSVTPAGAPAGTPR